MQSTWLQKQTHEEMIEQCKAQQRLRDRKMQSTWLQKQRHEELLEQCKALGQNNAKQLPRFPNPVSITTKAWTLWCLFTPAADTIDTPAAAAAAAAAAGAAAGRPAAAEKGMIIDDSYQSYYS